MIRYRSEMGKASSSIEMELPRRSHVYKKAENLRKGTTVMAVLLAATLVAIIVFLLFATGTINVWPSQGGIEITESHFGSTNDGVPVKKFTMTNSNGMSVDIITLGGTMTSIRVPDSRGYIDNVVLGFDSVAGYQSDMKHYFSPLIGRYAHLIANGMFTLDNVTYSVTLNTYGNHHHIHGGIVGWDKYVWDARVEDQSIVLNITSPDGDQGFPGEVQCNVTFTLTEDNELRLEFRASVTGKATPINLTTHPYFNLGGHASGDIYDHDVQINANDYLPIARTSLVLTSLCLWASGDIYDHDVQINANDYLPIARTSLVLTSLCLLPEINANDYLPIARSALPTGEIASVTGTRFDLRQPTNLGAVIGSGYDHTFCLYGTTGKRLAACVSHPGSGRTMDVYTDQPGIRFYTGNNADIDGQGIDGATYSRHSGFCLVTENYPDAPNHENFPDSILRPGSVYIHNVWYKFSA